jgi:hypothetical protein
VDATGLIGRSLSGDGGDQFMVIQQPVISDNQDRLKHLLLAPQTDLQEIVSVPHETIRCQAITAREMRINYGR